MGKLDRYVNYACGSINFDIKNHSDLNDIMIKFVDFCESYKQITNYYLIAHDDTDVPHIHFIFYCTQHVMLITLFNQMRKFFVPNYTRDEYGINIMKCENINAHLKYFLHLDKESIAQNKKQFNLEDIVSNEDMQVIDNYIHSKKGQIDAYLLRDAVLDNIFEFDLMVKLTLPLYHRYRYEIQILKDERAHLEELRKKERQEKLESELPF